MIIHLPNGLYQAVTAQGQVLGGFVDDVEVAKKVWREHMMANNGGLIVSEEPKVVEAELSPPQVMALSALVIAESAMVMGKMADEWPSMKTLKRQLNIQGII